MEQGENCKHERGSEGESRWWKSRPSQEERQKGMSEEALSLSLCVSFCSVVACMEVLDEVRLAVEADESLSI